MTRISERFMKVIYDYEKLTMTSLSMEHYEAFIANEAVKRLSVHESSLRLKAGIKARVPIDSKKFTLEPLHWIDTLYEISAGHGDRVWITRGGFRFHAIRDCSGITEGQEKANSEGRDTYNPQFVKRAEAINYGKRPCRVCKPNEI